MCVYKQWIVLANACINLTIHKQNKELDPRNPLFGNLNPTKVPSNLCDHHLKSLNHRKIQFVNLRNGCVVGVSRQFVIFSRPTHLPLPKTYHNGHHNLGYINIIIYLIHVNDTDHIYETYHTLTLSNIHTT